MADDEKMPTRLPTSQDVDKITRSNQLNSLLLRLPGEIRNRIYEYTLSGAEVCVSIRDPFVQSFGKANSPVHVLATCKQIRFEASSTFWKRFTVDATNFFDMQDLRNVMKPQVCARVTTLVLNRALVSELHSGISTYENCIKPFPLLQKVFVVSSPGYEVQGTGFGIMMHGIFAHAVEVIQGSPK